MFIFHVFVGHLLCVCQMPGETLRMQEQEAQAESWGADHLKQGWTNSSLEGQVVNVSGFVGAPVSMVTLHHSRGQQVGASVFQQTFIYENRRWAGFSLWDGV